MIMYICVERDIGEICLQEYYIDNTLVMKLVCETPIIFKRYRGGMYVTYLVDIGVPGIDIVVIGRLAYGYYRDKRWTKCEILFKDINDRTPRCFAIHNAVINEHISDLRLLLSGTLISKSLEDYCDYECIGDRCVRHPLKILNIVDVRDIAVFLHEYYRLGL